MNYPPSLIRQSSGSTEREQYELPDQNEKSAERKSDNPLAATEKDDDAEEESIKLNSSFDPIIKQGNPDEMENDQVNIDAIKKTLLSGEEEELLIALFETQQILKNCHEVAVQVLVPVICQRVMDWTYNRKLSAAEALMAAVISGIPTSLAQDISATAFNVINGPCDQSTCELWGDLLVATLPGVTWSTSKLDEVIDLLEMKYAASGDPLSRQLAARILGSLATCSTDDVLKRRIMDRAIVITGDKDPQVRGMVAESLSSIGASVHVSVVERELWPCLLNLLKDEDARIHAASIRTLSVIAAAHRERHKSSKLFTVLLPPVVLQECANIRRDAAQDLRSLDDDLYLVLEINAQVFGKLLYSCYDYIQDEVARKGTFKAFLAMATCNGPVIRKHCAFNMPAVCLCMNKSYGARLSAVVEYLSRDAGVETRWMLAAGMHETSRILARSETRDNLFSSVLVLLQDSEFLVRNAVLEHFEELITGLAKQFGYKSAQKMTPIFKNLQLLAKGQWRTQELLAKQLQLAVPLVPPPSLKMDVLPMLYQMAEGGAYRVRKAAMEAVAICIRYIPDVTERDKVMKSFSVEWAHGTVYWMRVAFIDSATAAVKVYSRCLFRDTFGAQVVRLAGDTVANVRLRTALLLPKIAPACHQMEEFEAAVDALKKDEDKDVFESMSRIDERIELALREGSEKFEEDMKREEEERELYSRHIIAQREVQRTKNAMKRRPGALLGKAAKGLQVNSSRGTAQAVVDDAVISLGSFGSGKQGSATLIGAPKKSNSFTDCQGSPSRGNGEKRAKPASPKVASNRKARAVTLPSLSLKQGVSTRLQSASKSAVADSGGMSPGSSGSRAFKGLRNLMSPKGSSANPQRGKGSRRSLA